MARNSVKIGILQFPGSNTERETMMACERVGLEPKEFLWNQESSILSDFDGYIIIGGFSYEDRSRAGIIAALDPIMSNVRAEALKGKPVLGICNGAQILVESGMVPGVKNDEVCISLSDNKRMKGGALLGHGYYNVWSNLKMCANPKRSAFTLHLKKDDIINIPLAHGEGRFLVPDLLLKGLIKNQQTIYQYCDQKGTVIDEFPTNPNGSTNNIAALCNAAGNVMAIMPHPERTENGDPIFSSMKEYIQLKKPITKAHFPFKGALINGSNKNYNPKGSEQWVVDMIITDNEQSSVNKTLHRLGFDVSVKRQTHWEITIKSDKDNTLKNIKESGELYNPSKEHLSSLSLTENSISVLIRQKEDILGRLKKETLERRFDIQKIIKLKRGVIWNISANSGNINSVIKEILNTNILYNPLSHECYRVN